ncbi:DUF6082 family protein [Catellatospora bangladeshensis]|uniref:Uncharacterized protein n=1 Tax=Catellatospora bangladeshensis TaxID=310355 RepID=A0A8J3NMI6_9ACTN|nr:DUF6082 family protein [Catellatospora bangladeshensis]GIF85063.1 hypothetical protein Cba03nite_64120 [Catellatospora bangladeshensis]
MLRRGSAKLPASYALSLLTTAALIAVVLLSPLLLETATKVMSGDWSLLSDVGQTYGAASAILSSFALIGIVLSIAVSLRQARVGQQDAARSMQFELMKLQLDDPTLNSSLPPDASADQVATWRRSIYRNMMFMYLRSSYFTEDISPDALRLQMEIIFRSPEARAWWPQARPAYATGSRLRMERMFVRIVNEQWRTAAAAAAEDSLDAPTMETNEPAPPPARGDDAGREADLG